MMGPPGEQRLPSAQVVDALRSICPSSGWVPIGRIGIEQLLALVNDDNDKHTG